MLSLIHCSQAFSTTPCLHRIFQLIKYFLNFFFEKYNICHLFSSLSGSFLASSQSCVGNITTVLFADLVEFFALNGRLLARSISHICNIMALLSDLVKLFALNGGVSLRSCDNTQPFKSRIFP